jgi:hypothetical protein
LNFTQKAWYRHRAGPLNLPSADEIIPGFTILFTFSWNYGQRNSFFTRHAAKRSFELVMEEAFCISSGDNPPFECFCSPQPDMISFPSNEGSIRTTHAAVTTSVSLSWPKWLRLCLCTIIRSSAVPSGSHPLTRQSRSSPPYFLTSGGMLAEHCIMPRLFLTNPSHSNIWRRRLSWPDCGM